MGIEEFDPLVPVALNEYAARKNMSPFWFAHKLSKSPDYHRDFVFSGFASELLQDAKDYSVHAGRSVSSIKSFSFPELPNVLLGTLQEIYPEDIKLAVKLSDSNSTSADARETVANRVKEQLLKKNLTELADPRSVQNRYPAEMFMQRSHTYIPGGEAYTDVQSHQFYYFGHLLFTIHHCLFVDCSGRRERRGGGDAGGGRRGQSRPRPTRHRCRCHGNQFCCEIHSWCTCRWELAVIVAIVATSLSKCTLPRSCQETRPSSRIRDGGIKSSAINFIVKICIFVHNIRKK